MGVWCRAAEGEIFRVYGKRGQGALSRARALSGEGWMSMIASKPLILNTSAICGLSEHKARCPFDAFTFLAASRTTRRPALLI